MKNETSMTDLRNQFQHRIVRASAGTGKTFALSNRFLKLLASRVECPTILATTFTKKGAGEILDRIIGRLASAALDADKAAELSAHLESSLSKNRAGEILSRMLRNLHRLEIGTLDSFFSRIAKVFSLELGLPPNWEIVEEQQVLRMYDFAVQQVLQTESALELLSLMNKGEASRGVASLLQSTVEQIYQCYRESGNEPWNQIPRTQSFLPPERLEQILEEMGGLEMPTKSLAAQWQVLIEKFQTQDWDGFIKTTVFQNYLNGNFKYGRTHLPPGAVACFQKIHPHCQAYVEDLVIKQNLATQQLLEKFDGFLREAQNQTGRLRFDDITVRLQSYMRKWDVDRHSYRLDQQVRHVLLDEFQDTSLAQWSIMRPFAASVTEKKDELRSFFCVGDMKQAIYGWRGGIAEIFELVESDLVDLKSDSLACSYRSAPPVIDLVNQVFLNLRNYSSGDPVIDGAIHQWSLGFDFHTTARDQLAGYVTIEKADEGKDPSGNDSERDRKANDCIDRKTIERIESLLEGLPVEKTIGVIVRTNAEVSRLIAELQSAGIHASEEGGSSLTDSAAIDLILSAMAMADHPGDSLSRFHLSHSPLAEGCGLLPETVLNQVENRVRGIEAAAAIRARLLDEGYGAVVEDWARKLAPFCTRREMTRLQQLVEIAYSYANQPGLWEIRPKRFAEFVRNDVRMSDPSGSQVRVMTIHKAKGLEFDVVVYPVPQRSGNWSGSPPSVVVGRETPTSPINFVTRHHGRELRKLLPEKVQRGFDDGQRREVREAMCVLYVALTRAIHATHVIVSPSAKPEFKSVTGLLMATVCPETFAESGVIWENGDPQWFQQSARDLANKSSDTPRCDLDVNAFYLPEKIELPVRPLSFETRSGRGGSVPSTPSHDVASLTRPLPHKSGTIPICEQNELLSRCFDLVKWLDVHVPTAKELEPHLRKCSPSMDLGSVMDQFYDLVQREELQRLLEMRYYQSHYLPQFTPPDSLGLEANRMDVQTARTVTIETPNGDEELRLDRLILIYEGERLIGADVIAFDATEVGADAMQAAIRSHVSQQACYRTAVARLTRLVPSQISTRVIFLHTGQMINYAHLEFSLDEKTSPPHPLRANPSAKRYPSRVEDLSGSSTGESPGATVHRPQRKSKRKSPDSQQRFWDD
jgi:ATP-dependent helicase/nuclease subunit A